MTQELNQQELKTLRREKSVGYVFPVLLLGFGALFNLCYFVLPEPFMQVYILILLDIAILSVSYLIYYKLNNTYDRDLKNRRKTIREKILGGKEPYEDVEPGSGILYLPILGELFPKLWGQKMRKTYNYRFIVENNKYDVDEAIYNLYQPGDKVYMAFGEQSGLFLGFLPPPATDATAQIKG